jgi:prepilin signal peptidase PulO-like enzyme (type II secretory pathway)
MLTLIFFIVIAFIISYIDAKKSLIPDKIIVPAIVVLVFLKYLDNSLNLYDFYAVGIVVAIFLIPIILNMAFGGGDLRFGAFCAFFVGLKMLGFFIIFAGFIHIIILTFLRKRSFGFAPAMSLAAILSYVLGNI